MKRSAATATLSVQARIEDRIAREASHDAKPSAGSLYAGPAKRAAALYVTVGSHRSSVGVSMTGQRNFGLRNQSGARSAGGVSASRSAYGAGRAGSLPPLPAGSLNYDADARSRERAAGWFFAVFISLMFAIPLALVGIIRLFS